MGSRRTTIINETRVVRTATTIAPTQPPPQPVVQSGKVSGSPTFFTIGAVRRIQPSPDSPVFSAQPYNPFRTAWSTVPYLPFRPRNVYNPPVQPYTPPQAIANVNLSSAGTTKDEVCDDILQNPVRSIDNFNITGNGKATRFRFPVSGAPSEVAVTNNNTGNTVSSDDYNVLIRESSVSWIIFDTAPANGVTYNIKYIIGDNPFIRTVRAGDWTGWLLKLNSLQRQLESAKNSASTRQSYNFGYTTAQNRIPESSQYDVAIDAVIELKKTIQRPGVKLDIRTIATACNNLDDQLSKINAGTGKNSQADATYGASLVAAPAIKKPANIVFEFDDRYSSFSSGSDCSGFYRAGDKRTVFTRQYDSQIQAHFFDLNAGSYCPPPPPVNNPGVRPSDDRDSNENWGGSSSLAPTTSPRPQPRPSQRDTTPNTNSGGRAPSSSPRPEPRGSSDYNSFNSSRDTKDAAFGGVGV